MVRAINSTQYALGYAPVPAPLQGQLAVENAAGRFVAAHRGPSASSGALLAADLTALATSYPPIDVSGQAQLWSNVRAGRWMRPAAASGGPMPSGHCWLPACGCTLLAS
jgi:hypothetical protein